MYVKAIQIISISVALFILGVHFFSSDVEAIPVSKYKPIFIEYSQICLTDLKTKSPSCPMLEKLISFDTSNQDISGKFISNNGLWIREKPIIQNHYKFYSSPIICVVCNFPGYIPDDIRIIFIEPSNHVWANASASEHNGKIVSYSDVFISAYCQQASLAFDNNTLTKTIKYMQNNCIGTSPMINQTKSFNKPTPLDYKSNPTLIWKYHLEAIKKYGSIGNCITKKCNLPKDPFKNW